MGTSTTPTREWTKLLGTSSYDAAYALTTSTDGTIYAAGRTYGSLGGQTSSGGSDAFLIKYDANGNKAWTKLLGTSSGDEAYALTTGTDGAIYMAGVTRGSLDGQTFSGGDDAFLTKYDANGNKIWTRLIGTNSNDAAYALTTGSDGAIYMAGYTGGSLDGQTSSGGIYDAFLTKYDANGAKIWTRLLGSSGNESAFDLTTGSDGAIYMAGYTGGSLDGQTYSGGIYDAFLTKYDANGAKIWTRLLGSSGNESANALTTGSDGAIYMAGSASGSLDGQTYSGGLNDALLTKYDANGNKIWTRLIGTNSDDAAVDLTTGTDGAIYITGYTWGNLDGQTSGGSDDAFLTKYDANGNKIWTRLSGGDSNEFAQALSTGTDGAIYMAGETTGNLDGQVGNGARDAFLSKWVVNTALATAQFSTISNSTNEGNTGSTTVTVQATLSAASTQAVTIPITYSGTATSGTDYTNAASSITIAAGQTTGTASFFVTGDTTVEPDETVILTMGTPSNAVLGANNVYTHTIVNEDTSTSDTRKVWLQKSIAGNQLVVDVIVNQGVSAHGVDFELDVPTGLTLEASSSNFSNTNGWTVLAAHSANRVSFIASAVDDSSGSALGVTSQDLVARLVFTMAPSASTAIVASEASYTLRIPTTAGAAYYETVPIASMPINAAPTGGLTLTPPSEKSSATLAAAAVESAHVFWGYLNTDWGAPSITLNNSISGSTPLWIEATGSRYGMFNAGNDTRGDDTNAAGVRFDENNPNYLGTVTYDQLNLPDGTMLGNYAPYGATLIGNPQLGWKPLFNPQGNGLGTVRQNEDFVSAEVTLNDLFGQTLSSGTKLFLAYADDDNGNPGTYNISFFESLPGYRQGSTLEVSTAALADADGLGSFSYKWQSSSDGATWATIGGATTVALTLSQAEVGKYIRAQISYTDGGGTQEVITSSASTTRVANVNDPPTGQVTINGTAQQNATLTVSNTLADLDGIPDPGQSGALSYQWFADGVAINGATATTFSLDQSHVGKAISVRASYIDSYGAAETSNSAPTAPVQNVNDPVQGAVLINGTPARGQTLTASNTLTDVDGIPTAGQSGALTYQWFANTSPIVDAIASSFTLTEAQVGKTITVKVSYTDLGGTAESVTSAATPAVYNVNRAPAFSNLGGSVVFTKGGTAVLIDSNATVSDPDAPANFDQATLSISRQGGANAQDSFGSTGYLGALSEGGSLTYDGATVGTVTQNSGGSLNLTFNSAATASVVNRVMQHLTYANASAIPDHRAPLTWTFNDGNMGAQGIGGSAEAVGQVVVENVQTLSVSTTFWKSGAPLSGVDLTLVGVGLNGADDGKLIAKGVALVGSNLSFDLWTESTSTTSIAGYDVDAVTPASWSTAFEENVRTGWTVVQAQDAVTRVLALSAMSSGAANDLTLPAKLGSVDYTLPSGGNATEIIYTQWGVSTRNVNSITASPMPDLYRSIAQAESANGQATINSLVPDAYNVVASAPLTTNRYITSADALSALKIAVGLSPNPGSTPVTVAQFAAADVDRSGAVNSADALNVLKMAVGLSTAPAKSWIWFTNSAAGTIVNTTSASVSDWMNDVVAPAESQTLQLVGVLRGDVDGSWTPPPAG